MCLFPVTKLKPKNNTCGGVLKIVNHQPYKCFSFKLLTDKSKHVSTVQMFSE